MNPSRHRTVLGGQALIELMVALLAIIPLYFGVVWLARLLDLQQATISAARQLAFECTVRPDRCDPKHQDASLAGEIRRRAFSSETAGVLSNDTASGLPGLAERRAFWVDRDGASLIERFEDVHIELVPERFNSPFAFAQGQAERAFPGALQTLSSLAGPGRFGLDLAGGFISARVSTKVSASAPADAWITRMMSMPLTLNARLAILTDAWNASAPYGPQPDSVQTRVESGARVPLVEEGLRAAWLPVRALLETAAFIGFESSAQSFRPHAIDVDRVPPDRLGSAAAPSSLDSSAPDLVPMPQASTP